MNIIIKLRDNDNLETEMKFLESRYGVCKVHSCEGKDEQLEVLKELSENIGRLYEPLRTIARDI